MQSITSENAIDLLIRNTRLLALLAGWANARYFDDLARKGPARLDILDGDPRALTISARALANAGLLYCQNDAYSLTDAAKNLMQKGLLSGPHFLNTLHELGRITSILHSGGPAPDKDGHRRATKGGVIEGEADKNRAFMTMLYRRSHHSADLCADQIASSLTPGATILDVGGGHGGYAAAFAHRGLRPTVMDKPFIIDLAKELHGDTLSYCSGDFLTDDLGGPFDAAFLSNILHGLSVDENRLLLSRVNDTLKPGGLLIIKDAFLDDDDPDDDTAIFFAITMLLYTAAGDSPKLDTTQRWLRQLNLRPLEPVGFQGKTIGEGWRLLFARKPAP